MAIITLNSATTFQTHYGWEVGFDLDYYFEAQWKNAKTSIIDNAVNVWKINRVSSSINCGIENPIPYMQLWENAGGLSPSAERTACFSHLYETKGGVVQTKLLDLQYNEIVVPFTAALAPLGEPFIWVFRNIAYTGDVAKAGDGSYNHDTPAKFATYLLNIFNYLQSTYGRVFDFIDIINEPGHVNTNAVWNNGTKCGNYIKAAGDALTTAGFTPRFTVCSCETPGNALTFIPAMMAVSGVPAYVHTLTHHQYGSTVTTANIQALAAQGATYGKPVACTEVWGPNAAGDNSLSAISRDLRLGNQSYTEPTTLPNFFTFNVANTLVTGPRESPPTGNHSRFWRQIYRRVYYGAVRYSATSNDSGFEPIAYSNPNNGHTVCVIVPNGAGPITIQGLPAATYGIDYTTSAEFITVLANQTITTGQNIVTSIPAPGVITVYNTAAVSPPQVKFAHRLRVRN